MSRNWRRWKKHTLVTWLTWAASDRSPSTTTPRSRTTWDGLMVAPDTIMTCVVHCTKWTILSGGDWKRETGKYETVKNARLENAGLEYAAPNCMGGKCETDKRGTKPAGVKHSSKGVYGQPNITSHVCLKKNNRTIIRGQMSGGGDCPGFPLKCCFVTTWSASSVAVTWKRWQSHHSILHGRKPSVIFTPHSSIFFRSRLIADWTWRK